jgi:hypothetical protein
MNSDTIYTVCKEFTYTEALASNDHTVRAWLTEAPECGEPLYVERDALAEEIPALAAQGWEVRR